MLKAESLLEIGQFFEASQRFEEARLLHPANPLPWLGKGHALLAAGDYRSAAAALVQALEREPNLTRFQIDLESMLGGGETVDIRRADIMRILERREDPTLRFLLGYLEYHSGSTESGMNNLRKAATQPGKGGFGSVISAYPTLLERAAPTRALPLPTDMKPVPNA
ncbi:MAG: hypothetical protein GY953_36600, partial [bacterium]|nr:hypothetical protein [bacterium]